MLRPLPESRRPPSQAAQATPTTVGDNVVRHPTAEPRHEAEQQTLDAEIKRLANRARDTGMDAWGFEYRTSLVWVKDKIGMGYYARQQHEFLLIGRRGEPSHPEASVRPSSVFEAPRREHSAKPVEAYELIETSYPDATRVELFARSLRQGWTSWGHEVAA